MDTIPWNPLSGMAESRIGQFRIKTHRFGISIRQAELKDLADLALFIGELYGDDFFPEGEKMLRDLNEVLHKKDCHLVLIAENAGKTVGLAWKPLLNDACPGSSFPSMAVLSLPLMRSKLEQALKAG